MEQLDAPAHAADTSTWVRGDGRWLCALHTEPRDPFGEIAPNTSTPGLPCINGLFSSTNGNGRNALLLVTS